MAEMSWHTLSIEAQDGGQLISAASFLGRYDFGWCWRLRRLPGMKIVETITTMGA